MKKSITCLLLFAFCITSIFAQSFIQEEMLGMSKGTYNALVLELPNANDKKVQKTWEKFTSKTMKGKSKYDKKTDEVFTEGVRIKEMNNNSFDMYAKSAANGAGATLTVWVDLGDDFLDSESDPNEFRAIEKQLYDFALLVERNRLEDRKKDEEKALKKLNNELKKLGKDKEGYEKDIEKAKAEIAKRENDIEQNLTDQENKEQEIKKQMRIIEATQDEINDL